MISIAIAEKELTIAGVDAIIVVVENVVVNMSVTEAERGRARASICLVVVGIGDGDWSVLGAAAVRGTDERPLVVVGELAVGHGNTSAAVGDVEETVVAARSFFW